MLPVVEVHRLAATTPPYVATAAVLLGAAALTLLLGLLRARGAIRHWLPGLAYLTLGALLFGPFTRPGTSSLLWYGVFAATTAAFALHIVASYPTWRAAIDAPADRSGAARGYLLAAVLLSAVLLFHHLGTYAGALLPWEATVVQGFADRYAAGQHVLTYIGQRFLWDDGILSAGQTSLFYGAPTYLLFELAGFTPWALRFFAAVATVLSVLVIYALMRRFFGATAAGAVAIAFALNPAVLFYGRYGSSPAGTVLAVLLALWCVWIFLERDPPAWWMGLVCGVALFVATLQYSPARIVVLILLGFMPLAAIVQWRRLSWQRVVGLLLVFAVAAGAWKFEVAHRREGLFLNARGEQYFGLLENPYTIESLLGRKLVNNPRTAQQVTLGDKLALLRLMLETTIPEYWQRLLKPELHPPTNGALMGLDPPPLPLYYAPAILLILLGFAYSLARWWDWPHACLLAWVSGATVPLLLTNRVDAHRLMLFLLPLSIWTALGVREAARLLTAARVPRLLQHLLAALLVVTIVYSDIDLLYHNPNQVPQPTAGRVLDHEIEAIPGPVMLAWPWNHCEVSWVQLRMLARMRRDPAWRGTMMPEGLSNGIGGNNTEPTPYGIREVRDIARNTTVILAPAETFKKAAAALQRQGVRVAERGDSILHFYRIDGGAAKTGVPDSVLKPLPTIVIPPTPTPIPLEGGPQISLSTLKPEKVAYGFAKPRVDRTWDGSPLRMGGVVYKQGLGMHAWCRMTYAVPPNAAAFQAIIGLSDDVQKCRRAAVTFEVHDQNDKLLYNSGLIDWTTPPRPIHVDLHGTSAITLVVTDGGNGIDCDHADWARPSFLLAAH